MNKGRAGRAHRSRRSGTKECAPPSVATDPMNELHYETATGLLAAYRTRQLSPVEATRAVLARIEAMDGNLNAFCRLDAEGALAAAHESEQRWVRGAPLGLLDGIPVSIKDVVLVRGMATLYGSKTVDPDQPWDEDAPAPARLREHGAVLLGKTCTPDFGHRFVTDSLLTGITRNPWNTDRSPGGSSGGAGAALAAGMGPLAIGTDGGGSIRIPSAWSGVVGLKPTFGRVPSHPPSRWGRLSNVGPMARSVGDAALMMTVISRPDPRDWQASPPDGRDYRIGLEDGVQGLRIAYSPDLGLAQVEPGIAASVASAVETLAKMGAHVEQVHPPGIEGLGDVYVTLKAVNMAQMAQGMSSEQRALLDPMIGELHEAGGALSATDYQQALLTRQELAVKMQAFFQSYDLLAMPTFHISPLPVPGLPADLRRQAPPLTSWANLTEQPAVSVPCGLTGDGLPIGLQIVGPRHADALVLRAARAYESARGPFPHPPLDGD